MGHWSIFPKRTNLNLATPEAVAKSVRHMIINRKDRITLTGLGRFANFSIRYLPWFSDWLLWLNREKIKMQFTMIGGKQVDEINAKRSRCVEVFFELEADE